MDAKVIAAFADKEDGGKVYAIGAKYTAGADRVRYLAERGFVEVAEKAKAAPKKEQ